MPQFRIGHGFDVHQFERGKPLKLCSVTIPYYAGLKAHSDGDVAIHAICDAILGALALGDLGKFFPDTDHKYQNMASSEFLLAIKQMLDANNYQISNLDLTIITQHPKLADFILSMRQSLSQLLMLSINNISVKATTTEHLGFEGRGEGISAHSVVMLEKFSHNEN